MVTVNNRGIIRPRQCEAASMMAGIRGKGATAASGYPRGRPFRPVLPWNAHSFRQGPA